VNEEDAEKSGEQEEEKENRRRGGARVWKTWRAGEYIEYIYNYVVSHRQ